mmetsp:Transcript_1558/g.2338  ORF Transcript_1558/g.2338 Transcript_1558/m.2338 type:complete len:260 (+) Transcript_1558:218-997(+)
MSSDPSTGYYSVAIDTNIIVCGDYNSNTATIYHLDTTDDTVSQTATLYPGDSSGSDYGYSVAVSGNLVMVGEYGRNAAWIYMSLDGGFTFTTPTELTASVTSSSTSYEHVNVALTDNFVIAGHTDSSYSGYAALFQTQDEGDSYEQITVEESISESDGYGWSVDINDYVVIISAFLSGSGTVYSYWAPNHPTAMPTHRPTHRHKPTSLPTALPTMATSTLYPTEDVFSPTMQTITQPTNQRAYVFSTKLISIIKSNRIP